MIDIIYADKKDKYFTSDGTQEYNFKEKKEPETFAELQELCKNLKSKSITIYNDAITIDFPSINGGFNFHIYITSDGKIDINCSQFAIHRTISQLWEFIKSITEQK